MKVQLTFCFLLIYLGHVYAQENHDSLAYYNGKIMKEHAESISKEADSKHNQNVERADSFRIKVQSSMDSIQRIYYTPISNLNSAQGRLQHKIDSLRQLGERSAKILHTYQTKLDSVTRVKSQQVNDLNRKVEAEKSKALSTLSKLNLPPEMRGPVDDLKKSIASYSIPMVNGKIPTVDPSVGKIPGMNIPQANIPGSPNKLQVPGVGNTDPLAGMTKETQQLSTVSNQAGTYTKDIKNVASGNMDDVKTLDKKLESAAMNTKGTEELKSKTAELEKYKKQMDIKPDSLSVANVKEEVTRQFTRDAVNHFAGQEVLLQDAMSKMDKYKKKYKDVKNIAELPKRLPNPLRGMPIIERIIPGVSFQIYNRNGLQSDINGYAVYQFTPRFSSGMGWVERVTFSDKATSQLRVYGPRAAFRMDWTKGITFTVQPELLNTYVQPQFINAPGITEGRREWVWSGMVTVRKSFRFRKNINAFTELLYNFHNPQNKSPYPDPLMMRFGFEFKLHKRQSGSR